MFSECENNGMSERCNLEDCEVFWEGDCKDPALIVENEELECEGIDYIFIDYDAIYKLYPDIKNDGNKPKKEKIMDKNQAKLDVQRVDREKATGKVESLIKSLSTHATSEFFNGESKEIFNETIQVPVRVSCFEQSGTRKVYVNAFGADGAKVSVVVSKELIECLRTLRTKVDELDAELGCENLNEAASKL